MAFSTGKYGAAIVRWADGAPELCTNGVTCSRSFDISYRQGVVLLAPGDRGCMDRKGKRLQNGRPQGLPHHTCKSESSDCSEARQKMAVVKKWNLLPSRKENRPCNPRGQGTVGRTLQLTRWNKTAFRSSQMAPASCPWGAEFIVFVARPGKEKASICGVMR